MPRDDGIQRRSFGKVVLTLTAGSGLLGGCLGNGDGGSEDPEGETTSEPADEEMPGFDGWMDNVGNYSGIEDLTDEDKVTVSVGVEANGGNFGFGPAAVRVSTGTTITWEWTGKGSQHNVVDQDGSFESELVDESGHTFSHAFDSSGTFKYACTPHKTVGMKGVVVVE